MNLTLLIGIFLLYFLMMFIFIWIDNFKWMGTTHKGFESFYNWYWGNNFHTIYINKVYKEFYFQHYYKEVNGEYMFEDKAQKKIIWKLDNPPPKKNKETNQQDPIIKDVHELMNKVKGDI